MWLRGIPKKHFCQMGSGLVIDLSPTSETDQSSSQSGKTGSPEDLRGRKTRRPMSNLCDLGMGAPSSWQF